MELGRFVRITRDGSATSGGTGYLLAGNLVLTARHVVEKARSLAVHYDGPKGPASTAAVEVVWSGAGDLDVAVLSAATERRIARQVVGAHTLEFDQPWRSCGWASAATAAPAGSSVIDSMSRLRGTAYQGSPTAHVLELGVEDPPEAVEWWAGVSGAPVFCGWRLIGVIVHGHKAFTGNRLKAVPLSALWGAPGFLDAIEFEKDRESRRQRRRVELVADLRETFTRNPGAAEALAARDGHWRAALDRKPDGGPEALAEAIVEASSWRRVVSLFNQVHREILEHGSGATAAADAGAIVQVLERVLPEIYGSTEIETLGGDESGGLLVTLPIESETLAEISMAAIDGRRFAFEEVEEAHSDPRGRARFVPKAKDQRTDFDFQHEGAVREAVIQLADKLILNPDVLAVLKLPGRFGDLARRVDRLLELDVSEHREPRRYYLYRSQDRRAQGDFLSKLREKLPALHVVELAASTMTDELNDTDPLQCLLFRAALTRKKG